MQIVGFSAYLVKWPFRMAVEHNLARNTATCNIVLRVQDQEGHTGWGESVPRPYVTGEQAEASLSFLRQRLLPALLGRSLQPEQVWGLLPDLLPSAQFDTHPAALCAAETALLDLAGQRSGQPLWALLGSLRDDELIYSGVVPQVDGTLLEGILAQTKELGLSQVKVKVGDAGDLERLATVRKALGPEVRLRVDANGAWSQEEALARIEQMAAFGVESIEQPVAAADPVGLLNLARQVDTLLIADESLCTLQQARQLAEGGAGLGFNLRLSKCGGLKRSQAIWELAREAGLPCQLGCQVGELGVLSAAGRHFASVHQDLIHLEGSMTRFFVSQDLVSKDISFGSGGKAPVLGGPGLGVEVEQWRLEPFLAFTLS